MPLSRKTIVHYQRLLSRIAWALKADGELGAATALAIRKFQQGYAGPWALKRPLPINGRLTRRTRLAIRWSAGHDGRVSEHFRFAEFRSKGNGDVIVLRALIQALERLRAIIGRSIPIVSGYRDPYYNDNVIHGAAFSQHKYGAASDVPESMGITIPQATKAGFSGIGYDEDDNFVEHVDVRHAGPNNTTGATPGHPTTWRYS